MRLVDWIFNTAAATTTTTTTTATTTTTTTKEISSYNPHEVVCQKIL